MSQHPIKESVKNYYGHVLNHSDDLKTDACCTYETMPDYLKPILSKIHDDVLTRYYGCGLVLPEQLRGLKILDLGCGAGRDVYALSALVGERGEVVGIDMTEQQLEIAKQHQGYHADQFGFNKSNVTFIQGDLDQLANLDLPKNHFDLVVSNCVINLVPNKQRVLNAVFDLLKPGGEMYFSDVYSDRRIPAKLANDEVLYGECLSGALYWRDFLEFSKQAGFTDPRMVKSRPLTIENAQLQQKVAHIQFYSATYRLFKIDGLETACEDYGQAVIYQGSLDHQPNSFSLDEHHLMETGRVFPVCGNTFKMLNETRFREHFEFIGDGKTHFGIFEGCGTTMPFQQSESDEGNCC